VRLIEVVEEDVDQLLQDLAIGALDRIAAAHDVRWQSDQRATGFVVAEVVLGKIGETFQHFAFRPACLFRAGGRREPQPSLRKEQASGSQHIANLPDLMKRAAVFSEYPPALATIPQHSSLLYTASCERHPLRAILPSSTHPSVLSHLHGTLMSKSE
jgi:hypothetical protein